MSSFQRSGSLALSMLAPNTKRNDTLCCEKRLCVERIITERYSAILEGRKGAVEPLTRASHLRRFYWSYLFDITYDLRKHETAKPLATIYLAPRLPNRLFVDPVPVFGCFGL